MRAPAPLGLLLVAAWAGCLADGPGDDAEPTEDPDPAPRTFTFYLRPGHRLDPEPGNASAPQRVRSAPTANAYVNEALESFESSPVAGFHATRARLLLYYGVDHPTADPFRNGTNALEARHFVFWAGSGGIYPTFLTVWGPAALVPGDVYHAEVDFPLGPGGWTVPTQENVSLLVAPLALNAGTENLHYYVDHADAASRLEIEAVPWYKSDPPAAQRVSEEIIIPGNSGLFTGATGDAATVRRDVELRPNTTYLRVEVRWQSTLAGKSDLDLWLLDGEGTIVAASTTPYQNETIRLFGPQLDALGEGPFTAEIDAYSGAMTRFDLVLSWGFGDPLPVNPS